MKGRLSAQILKELLAYLRDPKSRLTLIGPPLLQLFIFSFAVTLDVSNVDIAVLNEDGGQWSQEMIQRMQAAGFVGELHYADRPAALAGMIDRREVLLAIRFPADFSRLAATGQHAVAQVIIDGRRANSGQVALGYLARIAADLGIELGDGRAPPRVAVRHWFNPNLIYRWFVVPSLAGMLAMLIALLVTALSIARERELGTFDQLLVSPATSLEIVIGKSVPALIIGTILGCLMILAGVFIFRIPFTGSAILLVGCLMLFILSVVGIGLMVSSVCQTQQQAILGTFTIAVPVILISGFATPVENMPQWLQTIAAASPLKYFLVIVQGTFLKALPPAVVFANAWPMALIALVTLSSSMLIVRRNLQ
ncbi:MAG TPA: ABC transporter permease [Woeseiaceae bacterium]|nr:ABC transporter permease [Woeseiaceae bacterium]